MMVGPAQPPNEIVAEKGESTKKYCLRANKGVRDRVMVLLAVRLGRGEGGGGVGRQAK